MRIHILSDLHLEFAGFEPPKVDADVVILAGDVHNGRAGLKWIGEKFPKRRVIYVLGNHEFYGHQIPRLTDDLKKACKRSQIHVLENDRLELDDVVFLGATLWTDFRLNGNAPLAEAVAATDMTDFHLIRVSPSDRRFRPADAGEVHARSIAWLDGEIRAAQGRKLVVVTHHAPSARSIPPRFQNHPLNPAFASDLDQRIVDSGAAIWVHGHIHYRADYTLASTRVIANPRGYPDETDIGFDASLTVEV